MSVEQARAYTKILNRTSRMMTLGNISEDARQMARALKTQMGYQRDHIAVGYPLLPCSLVFEMRTKMEPGSDLSL